METGWRGIVTSVEETDSTLHPIKIYVHWAKMNKTSWAMPESLKKLNK